LVIVGRAQVDPPRCGHPGFVSGQFALTEVLPLDGPPQNLLLGLDLRIQGVDLRPDRGAALDHPPLPLLGLTLGSRASASARIIRASRAVPTSIPSVPR